MIRASIYGRLGGDPVERETRTGKEMVTVSCAVNVARPDADDDVEWFSLIAFGRAAKDMMRHAKGDLIACMGIVTKNRYTARDGQERESWSLNVDAIVSARTVRPGGGRKRAGATPDAADVPAKNGAPFDDPIPLGMA